jgi:hypothetical protein
MHSTNLLVLLAVGLYLLASFVLWKLLLSERGASGHRDQSPGPRRWPIRLAKALVTLLGGAASGAVTLLAVATVVNAGKPGTLGGRATLAVWAIGTVAAMLFIGRAPMIRRAVSRTCLALGVQGVALPLATLLSFAVAGARLAGSAGTGGERVVTVLGVRLVGHLLAVWVGIGGFCLGLALVIVGDRARRGVLRRRRARRRFRSSRAGVLSTRARARARQR